MFENFKIGEIARTVVRQVLEAGISDAELNNLRNPDYCKQYLGLNVPMLIPYEGKIVKRYYVEPVNVNGENYLLTNDWYETPVNNDRSKLLEWLQSQEKNVLRINVSSAEAAESIKNSHAKIILVTLNDTPDENTLTKIVDAIRTETNARIVLNLVHTDIKELPDCTGNEGGLFKNCKYFGGLGLPKCFEADLSIMDFDNCPNLMMLYANNKKYTTHDFVLYSDGGKTLYMCPQGRKNIEIPEGITKISEYAFAGCKNLLEITYLGTTTQWFSINKEENWDEWITLKVIHCSDADIIFKNKQKDEN